MSTSKLKTWSDTIKARDNKCLNCGSVNDLHAHHILPKSTHPGLSLDITNGKTLCYRCHKIEHEKNRPIRIRSNKPHRSTLERRIKELEDEVRRLSNKNPLGYKTPNHKV